MELAGAEIVVQAIKRRGRGVWGYPRRCAVHLYDALFNLMTACVIILVRHEWRPRMPPNGYARATGKGRRRPGHPVRCATNAVTGKTAYMDSIPMVILTGSGADPGDRPRTRSRRSIRSASRPCVKHNFWSSARRYRRHDQEGVLHRGVRPAPSGRRRHPLRPPPTRTSALPAFVSAADRDAFRTTRSKRATWDRSASRRHDAADAERPVIYTGGGVVIGEARS